MTGPNDNEFNAWISATLRDHAAHLHCDLNNFSTVPIKGDAGSRQYLRLHTQPSLVAVYAPPEKEKNSQFIKVDEHLRKQGVHVPKIVAEDSERGFFILEDLGETLFCDSLSDDSADLLYGEASIALLRIQQCSQDKTVFPFYDRELLSKEMHLFDEWFVNHLLAYTLDDNEQMLLENVFSLLVGSALAQPQVLVHRDYHSRNILINDDGGLGLVDFQDAVIGPFTYDIVSLLRDCYIAWPDERVRQWALAYACLAEEVGIVSGLDEAVYLRWFDLMGLQRHIKVCGIFARLSLRDNKPDYLEHLPRVIAYIQLVLGRYPELQFFHTWFESKIMPLIKEQTWMRKCESVSN